MAIALLLRIIVPFYCSSPLIRKSWTAHNIDIYNVPFAEVEIHFLSPILKLRRWYNALQPAPLNFFVAFSFSRKGNMSFVLQAPQSAWSSRSEMSFELFCKWSIRCFPAINILARCPPRDGYNGQFLCFEVDRYNCFLEVAHVLAIPFYRLLHLFLCSKNSPDSLFRRRTWVLQWLDSSGTVSQKLSFL